jgi:hypothetical protein
MSNSDLLRRLFGRRDATATRSTSRRHPHEEGHESQVGYLGKKARAREADPAHKHHEHGSDKR